MIRLLALFEAAAFIGALLGALLWYNDVPGRWEQLAAVCTAATGVIEIARRRIAKVSATRFLTDGARIQHRESLRKQFEEELYKCRAQNLRQDVIVRHVDRVDAYPNVDPNAKGISPWFRVGFLDVYERGIVLCLGIGGLKKCDGGYRFADHVNKEEADAKAWLMADVPYDSIEAVNMDGDKYYSFPHIYCYFDFASEPYERKWFAEKIDQAHGHPYFKQIAEYDAVVANNPTEGPLYFA